MSRRFSMPCRHPRRPPQRWRHSGAAGFQMVEVVVAALLILLLSSLSISAALNEWRGEQAYAVSEELAGWLVLVQRAAMRGARCDVTIAPTTSAIATGQTVAQASQSAGGSLTNSCNAYSPLRLESTPAGASFSITPAQLSFSFTPRGTIASTSSDPVVITVSNQAGGAVRCIRLDGLLGITRLGQKVGGSCQV